MKILIDECLPRRLKHEFPRHEVHTVPEMGWAGKKNGELLKLMSSAEFEVFITVDQNLRHQQNLSETAVRFVVLVASNNKLETLQPLIPQVRQHMKTMNPGTVLTVYERLEDMLDENRPN